MKRLTLILLLTTSLCLSADWIEQQKILPFDGSEWDSFGLSVSISGDYAVIGAFRDDDIGSNSGSAYIFQNVGTNWSEQIKLTASDGDIGDFFGKSVSISGDYIVIGATSADINGSNTGAAYIFHWNGTTWFEQAKLTASDGADGDNFGSSVSISGDDVLIGATGDDDNGTHSGSVYIFHRNGTSWTEQEKITPSDGSEYDKFGFSVSISGEYAIIGTPYFNNMGKAYIYHKDGTIWNEQANITSSDETWGDFFAYSVSIDGDYVIIGAWGDEDSGEESGSAYVFHRTGIIWDEQTKLTASDSFWYDMFGYSVSISGNDIIIAAPGESDVGSAYIFHRDLATWTEQAKIIPSDGTEFIFFGISVSISADNIIIGAPDDYVNGESSGSAYIFHNYSVSINDDEITPVNTSVIGNHPNPFSSRTTISFNVTHTSRFVTIEIYNIKGQKIKSLECNICDVAETTRLFHSITWDGTDRYNNPAASGIYLYELNVDNKTRALRKCLLLR